MEDDRIAGELQVTRNPQCLIATVAKQASYSRRYLLCSSVNVRHMPSLCRPPSLVNAPVE